MCALPVYRSSYWAIDVSDWAVDADGGCVLFTSPDESADLRITTCDFDDGLTYQKLRAWADERAPVGTPIREWEGGRFSGVHYEFFDGEATYWREWLLTLAELVLVVNYCSEEGDHERHRDAVDRMLSTLVDNRP